jgi:hypothetical protein
MLWHQGESDALNNQHPAYQKNLTAFIADIRSHYGANLPFMVCEIRWDERRNGTKFKVISDAQIAVAAADPNTVFAPANDLTFKDRFHFDAAGQKKLGERIGAGYIALFNNEGDTVPPTLSRINIIDDKDTKPVTTKQSILYTITFSEDINEATLSATDFSNAGTAAVNIDEVNEISPGVFIISVTPTSAGTIKLQVLSNAVIHDNASNALDTSLSIIDDTTINVVNTLKDE